MADPPGGGGGGSQHVCVGGRPGGSTAQGGHRWDWAGLGLHWQGGFGVWVALVDGKTIITAAAC